MKELKMSRRTQYTRMVLQDSLIELMKEKSISKITIKELCEKADVNRTTFYAHYTDQYDLLRKIEDEVLLWLKEAIITLLGKITDKSGTMQIMEEICHYFVENSKHLQVLMSEQGDIDFQKEIFTLIYQQCGMSSLSPANISLGINEDAFIFAVNGSVGLIQHWLKNGFKKSAKEMAETIYDLTRYQN
ncbi:TetR/AcrR family transcriptional regulator [Anaerocolumna sp.]|uniref:TetR/AcrR family transcriptional regulator n=1 Tax=Anaerocolumna sp. TaxID=2041569 RepID=UPI0028AAF138|nr:TetR-like C-terminal domain-containing protein [Anaerocolumna sp.]